MKCHICSTALFLASTAAFAQSSAFTYRGELQSNNLPVTHLHDFRFRLFDSLSGTMQIGPTLCIDNVPVTDGRFSVVLDFGPRFKTRDDRYVDLEVRQDTGLDCSNGAGFVVLGPRQLITPVPLAQHARTAFALDAPDGSPLSAVSVGENGNVGFGTSAPFDASLEIAGPDAVAVLQDSDADAVQSGYLGFCNSQSSETGWIGFGTPGSPVFSIVNTRTGGHISFTPGVSGNVGIDTAAPLAKLDVRGDIRMGAAGQQFALRGDENLRVIRGNVNAFGDRVRGTGFTCSSIDVGKYRIDFSTAFAGVPAVTVAPHHGFDGSFTASLESVTANSAIVVIWGMDLGRFALREFDFLAVGPR